MSGPDFCSISQTVCELVLQTELGVKEKMSSGHATTDQLVNAIRPKYGRLFQRKARTSSSGPFHILQDERQKQVEEVRMKREQDRAKATAEKNT